MTSPQDIDLCRIVLILGSFECVDEIHELSDNKRYLFLPPNNSDNAAWRGGQSDAHLKPPFFCLTIGEHLFDPTGWILGSHGDSEVCDFQIAGDNQSRISRRSVRVDISPITHYPRVTLLSDQRVRIRDGVDVEKCKPGIPVELPRPCVIDWGAVRCWAWFPERTLVETQRYKELARSYGLDIMAAYPKSLPSIKSRESTSAESVRYGKNDAVYVVEQMHGRGMHASVMRVKNIATGEIFGAKEPYYKSSDNSDYARKRFETLEAEYKLIMRLQHPHIVRAYELVLADELTLPPWMIVEYVPSTLRDTLPKLDSLQRLAISTQLVSALHYMHETGITHRDLRPDNALIQTQDGAVILKLADFGTSKHNLSSKMETFTGTEIYMAPELFIQPRSYTNKVDMWAFGLIELEMFTSWEPDVDEIWDPSDFGKWIRTVVSPCIANAPEKVRPMLKGLLRKGAEKRWSARRCLEWLCKQELDGSVRNDTGSKRPASSGLETERYKRHLRSPNPSPSTSRVALQHSGDGVSLPDTLSVRSASPEILSAATTPRVDDEISDASESSVDDNSSGDESGFENDWQE
ncbi:Calcium/calmodulin-dependent protein kinase type IV, partial [Metarhizium majus ARSEF 297]